MSSPCFYRSFNTNVSDVINVGSFRQRFPSKQTVNVMNNVVIKTDLLMSTVKMKAIFNISNKNDFAKVSNNILSHLLGDEARETSIISENDFNASKTAIITILIQTNCDINEINKLLSEKGFNADLVNIFCSELEKRRSSLLLLILLQHNSSFGETVITFDWLVKFVCGTSELKKLEYPLLQLAITTINNKQLKRHRSYDISKAMLTKIITVLENCD